MIACFGFQCVNTNNIGYILYYLYFFFGFFNLLLLEDFFNFL